MTFTVTRTGGTFGTLDRGLRLGAAGTATLGSDYTFTPGHPDVRPGAPPKTFTVHVNDDQTRRGRRDGGPEAQQCSPTTTGAGPSP